MTDKKNKKFNTELFIAMTLFVFFMAFAGTGIMFLLNIVSNVVIMGGVFVVFAIVVGVTIILWEDIRHKYRHVLDPKEDVLDGSRY